MADANRFEDQQLNGALFRNCTLAAAKFEDVNLAGGAFVNVNLKGANFTDVNLAGVAIKDANIKWADHRRPRYRRADQGGTRAQSRKLIK